MTSQSGYKKIAIQILSNISRTKGNQAIKFRQSIEKNTRNIFLEKSYTNCGAETVPRTFAKKQNLEYLWNMRLRFQTVCFYCMSS